MHELADPLKAELALIDIIPKEDFTVALAPIVTSHVVHAIYIFRISHTFLRIYFSDSAN